MPATHRVFFAIDLSPQLKTELMVYQDRISTFSATRIKPDNFHITLSFLGSISERKVEHLLEQMTSFQLSPFEISIGELIYFSKPQVLALSIIDGLTELEKLKRRIEHRLKKIDHFDIEKRAYKPHISLYRNIEEPIQNIPEFKSQYRVDSFCLFESTQTRKSVQYSVIEEWKFSPVQSIKQQLIGD